MVVNGEPDRSENCTAQIIVWVICALLNTAIGHYFISHHTTPDDERGPLMAIWLVASVAFAPGVTVIIFIAAAFIGLAEFCELLF